MLAMQSPEVVHRSSPTRGSPSNVNLKKANEELKRRINKLRAEVDSEKHRTKMVHKEKVHEVRAVRDKLEKEKDKAVEETSIKLLTEKHLELQRLRESMARDKDVEIRQILQYKEDELKNIQVKLLHQHEDGVRIAQENTRKQVATQLHGATNDLEGRLMLEIRTLKDAKKRAEEQYKLKCKSEREKEEEMKRMKNHYESEIKRILQQPDKEDKKDFGSLQGLKRMLKSKDQEITDKENLARKLQLERDLLQADLQRYKDTERFGSRSLSSTPRRASNSDDLDSSLDTTTKKLYEEKEKSLLRKNSELQTQVQRLEKRVSALKTDNETLKSKDGVTGPSQDIEHYKKVFARQRAKDLTDHAQKVLSKDKEIEELRRELEKQKVSQPNPKLGNSQIFTDKGELEKIVKQHAKEQLRLQRQISTGIGARLKQEARLLATGTPDKEGRDRPANVNERDLVNLQEYRALEETNRVLQEELRNLSLEKEEKEKLEVELAQQKIANEVLEKENERRQQQCSNLSTELQNVIEQNTTLTKKNTEAQQKLSHLDKVNEECKHLQEKVIELETSRQTLSNQRDQLQGKADKLEAAVKHMQEAAEKRKQLEAEYQEALQNLQGKQDEVRQLQEAQQAAKKTQRQAVDHLETKVKDLERKCQEQTESFSKLSQELSLLRKEANKRAGSPKVEIAIQTSPESLSDEGFGDNGHVTPSKQKGAAKKPYGAVPSSLAAEGVLDDESQADDFNDGSWVEDAPVTKRRVLPVESGMSSAYVEGDEDLLDIDEKERRYLLEEAGVEGLDDLSYSADIRRLTQSLSEDDNLTSSKGDVISAKSDSSAKGQSSRSVKHAMENGKMDSGSEAGDLLDDISDKIDMSVLKQTIPPKRDKLSVFIARYSYDPLQYSPNEHPEAELALNAGEYIYVYGSMDEDCYYEGELMDGRRGLVPSNFIERVADEDDVNTEDEDMPEFLQEPVEGEGEQMNDLEFDSSDEEDAVLQHKLTYPNELEQSGIRRTDLQVSDLEDIPEVEEDNLSCNAKQGGNEDSLTSISEIEDLSLGEVAFPRKLEVDRQMSNSIVLQWICPETITPTEIKEYRVIVDGQHKATVKGDAKTRALIDNINLTKSHRISVRTVTNKGQSEDAACTITIGKDATAMPSELKAVNCSSTSANIVWLPGNSNLAHAISVNSVEVRIVKPGIFRYQLTGLSPMSVYRVTVKAKSRKSSWDDTKNRKGMSAEIEFKTLPGGLPDPPLDVQVEEGPYDGSLLVTWLPVTITTSGTSNGAVVTGYAVCVDEKEIAVVESPTADRAVVNVSKVKAASYRYLTVRTLSTNGASADSRGLRVTMDLLRDKRVDIDPSSPRVGGGMYDNASDESTSVTSTHSDEIVEIFRKDPVSPVRKHTLDDRLDQVPKDEMSVVKKPEIRPTFREEIHSDESSDRSELSDITEEVEEELSDFDGDEGDDDDGQMVSAEFTNSLRRPKEFRSKQELEFDTDPEIEQFNQQDQTVPIPVIRQQRDYERETEQSPDHHVQEPVPVKAKPIPVPQIEITKDSNSEGVGTGSTVSEPYGSDMEYEQGRHGKHPPSQIRDKKQYYHDQFDDRDYRYDERKDTYGGSTVDNNQRKYSYRNKLSPNHARIVGNPDDDLLDSESLGSEAPEELYDDSTIRFFEALFTYDPATMSPNPESYDEELPFTEGQLIKVFGDKDADGFYRGEANGRIGYVPCNMVELPRLSEKEAEAMFQKQYQHFMTSSRTPRTKKDSLDSSYNNSMTSLPSGGHDDSYHSTGTANGKPPMPADEPVVESTRRMIALFDYDPKMNSPNVDSDVELTFITGDIIRVYGSMDEDGFYMGELHGRQGLVPSNFLEDIPPSPVPLQNSHGSSSPSQSNKTASPLIMKQQNSNSTKTLNKEAKTKDTAAKNAVSAYDTDAAKKKNKGLFSKGKALFKKFGSGSDTSTTKQKR
ncbi:uncharacterized protein LOC144449607 isoform X2 [Glandiceps talaboti]